MQIVVRNVPDPAHLWLVTGKELARNPLLKTELSVCLAESGLLTGVSMAAENRAADAVVGVLNFGVSLASNLVLPGWAQPGGTQPDILKGGDPDPNPAPKPKALTATELFDLLLVPHPTDTTDEYLAVIQKIEQRMQQGTPTAAELEDFTTALKDLYALKDAHYKHNHVEYEERVVEHTQVFDLDVLKTTGAHVFFIQPDGKFYVPPGGSLPQLRLVVKATAPDPGPAVAPNTRRDGLTVKEPGVADIWVADDQNNILFARLGVPVVQAGYEVVAPFKVGPGGKTTALTLGPGGTLVNYTTRVDPQLWIDALQEGAGAVGGLIEDYNNAPMGNLAKQNDWLQMQVDMLKLQQELKQLQQAPAR